LQNKLKTNKTIKENTWNGSENAHKKNEITPKTQRIYSQGAKEKSLWGTRGESDDLGNL
jgi:hypothetical protein